MRDRQRILDNLEKLYRDELDRGAEPKGAVGERLDFELSQKIKARADQFRIAEERHRQRAPDARSRMHRKRADRVVQS